MPYLVAIIALAGAAVLAWKAFGPRSGRAPGPLGPDDDPEFLRKIGHKRTDDNQ